MAIFARRDNMHDKRLLYLLFAVVMLVLQFSFLLTIAGTPIPTGTAVLSSLCITVVVELALLIIYRLDV